MNKVILFQTNVYNFLIVMIFQDNCQLLSANTSCKNYYLGCLTEPLIRSCLSLFLKMALEGSEDLQGAIQTVRLLKMANWQNPSHLRENLLF